MVAIRAYIFPGRRETAKSLRVLITDATWQSVTGNSMEELKKNLGRFRVLKNIRITLAIHPSEVPNLPALVQKGIRNKTIRQASVTPKTTILQFPPEFFGIRDEVIPDDV